jgi:two-component system NtrC family sensor kinase
MPRLDGVGLLYRLRENGIQIPVVLMTFHGSEELAIEVFRLGVRDYVIKPFSQEEMLGAVERALSEVRLRKERDHLTEQLLLANRSLERRVAELEALFDIGRVLTTLPGVQALMAHVVDSAVALTHSRRAVLLLMQDGRTLVEHAARVAGESVTLAERPAHDVIAWEAIQRMQTVSSEPLYDPVLQRVAVELCAPLVFRGSPLGVLCAYVAPGEDLDPALRVLAHLADYAALGLEQARLWELVSGR